MLPRAATVASAIPTSLLPSAYSSQPLLTDPQRPRHRSVFKRPVVAQAAGGAGGRPLSGPGETTPESVVGRGMLRGQLPTQTTQGPGRPSVATRMETLRSAEVSESSYYSAAVLELDALVRRRARRQIMVSKLNDRRLLMGSISWAVRSAACVCASAALVLDGSIVRHFSHGYGIWAIITCINCNEKLQGDLFRKSMERFLGTVIGGVAAMAVLFVDDYLVPEILGWNARAHFYLVDVAIFTVAGIYLRSVNKVSPAFDYSYFLAILSFDFLLLDSFSDANQYQDSIERILMVCAGGLITCGIGGVMFPQYAGQELMALSATAFEGTAAMLEVTASALVMAGSAKSHGPSAAPDPIPMAQITRMADLARYELRIFPCPQGKGSMGYRLSFQLEWSRFISACRAAQEVRELCKAATMFLEQHLSDSTWDYALPLSNHFEVELIVVVEEAAAVLRHCSDQLRCSWKRSARSGRVDQLLADQTYLPSPFSEACDDSLLRFEDALTALNQQLQSCGPHHRTPDSCDADTHDYYSRLDLQVASVRLLALKLSSKVMACVQSVEDIEGAGLLLTPSSFPPTLK